MICFCICVAHDPIYHWQSLVDTRRLKRSRIVFGGEEEVLNTAVLFHRCESSIQEIDQSIYFILIVVYDRILFFDVKFVAQSETLTLWSQKRMQGNF